MAVLAFFRVEACAVDVLLERSRGFVSVDDSAAAVGDGECVSACGVQCVVGASDDSLACEEVVARSAYVWFWSWVCGVVLGRGRARTCVAASAGGAKRCVGGRSWGVWVV